MSTISVANGWQYILAKAVEEASKLPPEWCLEIVAAERVDGALILSATYNSFDVPLDDYLPSDKTIPHPFRSLMRIQETARAKSLVTCECCGREGKLMGAGSEARVRCVRHGYVVDAVEWSSRAPAELMFESEDEAMAHFLSDYGDGLGMMQELQAAVEVDPDDQTST